MNLGAFETDGVDVTIGYEHGLMGGTLSHSLIGNYVFDNSEFPDPLDPNFELSDLGQLAIPELIVNYTLGWERDDFGVIWQMRWQDSQLNAGINNEDLALDAALLASTPGAVFADPLETGDTFVHDVSFRYQLTDQVLLTGGVNNLTDEEPFLDTLIRPVGPIGRTFFLSLQGSI